jgi:hypothetical protein
VYTKKVDAKFLKKLGIRVLGNRVCKVDLHKILGACFTQPEWIILHDYNEELPSNYVSLINSNEGLNDRLVFPNSHIIAPFGHYMSESGNVFVVGIVYQFSLKTNPRNIRYAYMLFCGSNCVAKNTAASLYEIKSMCEQEAKNLIECQLFDI